jgi:hypothetical protein
VADDLGFSFRARKDGSVEILREDRVVTVLGGPQAAAFLARMAVASPADGQQRMARVTGNYRRGNERHAGSHDRNHG